MKMECFKDIEGYESLYIVSNKGCVIAKSTIKKVGRYERLTKEIELKQHVVNNYLCVSLSKEGFKKLVKVHRLVAEHFIPNPDNKPQVNHIDENKLNNHVSNLEWMTSKENCNHGLRNNKISKNKSVGVFQYDQNHVLIKYYKSLTSTKDFGFDPSHVSKCINGKLKTHKGFIFKIN